MRCPYCKHSDDRVLDTRVHKDGEIIKRRRECLKCKGRFTTQEVLILSYPSVVKKDGRREAFAKEKVLHGIQMACQKRPVPLAQLDQLVERMSAWALEQNEKEISSNSIGQRVTVELKKLDDVAYVRFASVYKTFRDVNEFVQSLDKTKSKDLDI